MGFLDNLQVYAQKWEETARGAFSKADRAKVETCVVVESEYGLSACFHLVGGGAQYMPLSNDVELEVDDVIDMEDAEVITLSRPGDSDIYRLTV